MRYKKSALKFLRRRIPHHSQMEKNPPQQQSDEFITASTNISGW
jgi:hypothetical protein